MIRNISIVIGLAIILVVAILLGNKTPDQSPTPVQVQNQPPVKVINNQTNTNKTVKPVINSGTNYNAYITNLGNETNRCNVTAKDQFSKQYFTYEGGSFQSYYNQNTGGCYMTVTGKTSTQYTASTTAHRIFKDVYANKIIAECSDSIGITYATNEWNCVDRSTGGSRAINLNEYNDMIYTYSTRK